MKKMVFEKKDDLFVMGDDAYLYIVLGQQTPFYITFYNKSILYSQLNTVSWLERHKPKYVMWKSAFKEFDKVPNIVRIPLVFEKIMQDYVYAYTIGPFHILRRKLPIEVASLDFWRSNLGETVDLGYIPSRSDPAVFEANSLGSGKEANFLKVTINSPVHGEVDKVYCKVGEFMYAIRFNEREGITVYNIYLNRIWFWQLAIANQVKPVVVQSMEPGMSMQVKTVRLRNDVLY
ncbi:MAG: hypothetical protein HY758_03500 [Nitrospirae bacterium]|nr:hypothetical protein [Nitrospirota bacterium]